MHKILEKLRSGRDTRLKKIATKPIKDRKIHIDLVKSPLLNQ